MGFVETCRESRCRSIENARERGCVGIVETSRSRVSENAQLESVGILETSRSRAPETREHRERRCTTQPVNESAEFESEREWVGIV